MLVRPTGRHGVNSPAGRDGQPRDNDAMKKPKHWSQPTVRVHEDREDRARTWSGKTASRKIRNEARYLATLEQTAETQRTYRATQAKTGQAGHG